MRVPFVGREDEFATLDEALDRAIEGAGGVFLLEGEPGVGKSELLNRFCNEATDRRATALRWSSPDGGTDPWSTLIDDLGVRRALRALSALQPEARLNLAIALPAISRLMDWGSTPTSSGSDLLAVRAASYLALGQFLRAVAASDAPNLVIACDDVHTWDGAHLKALERLAHTLENSRVLLVATTRPGRVNHILQGVARARSRYLAIQPLGPDQEEALLRKLLGVAIDRSWLEAIYGKGRGLPFYSTGVVRMLRPLRGRLVRPAEPGDLDLLDLPDGSDELIARELSSLSRAALRAARVAALIGQPVGASLLSRCLGRRGGALPLLHELASLGLVRISRTSPGSYAFRHPLYPELISHAFAEGDPNGWRAENARVARILAADPGDGWLSACYRCGVAGELWEFAADAAIGLAEREMASYRYEAAASVLTAARENSELMTGIGLGRRCELLNRLGDALWCLARADEARDAFLEAARLAEVGHESQALARAVLSLTDVWDDYGSDQWLLPDLYAKALAAAADVDDEVRTRLLAHGGRFLSWSGSVEQGDSWTAQAVGLARRVDTPALVARALVARHDALWPPERAKERRTISLEALEWARRGPDPTIAIEALAARCMDALEAADMTGADHAMHEHRRLAEAIHRPAFLWPSYAQEATIALLRGEFDRGLDLAEKAHSYGQDVLPLAAQQAYLAQQMLVEWERGNLGALLSQVEGLGGLIGQDVVIWETGILWVFTESGGSRDQARALLPAVANRHIGTRRRQWLADVVLLSEVCAAVGDEEWLARLYRALRPHRSLCAVAGWPAVWIGPAGRFIGLLLGALGRTQEAAQSFESAIRTTVRAGARPAEARTRLNHGQVVLSSNESDAALRARALDVHLPRAIQLASSLGMAHVLAQAENLLESGTKVDERPYGLTTREAEVLVGISAGLTTREIARRHGTSPETVKKQRTKAYGKVSHALGLDLMNPADAARAVEAHPGLRRRLDDLVASRRGSH